MNEQIRRGLAILALAAICGIVALVSEGTEIGDTTGLAAVVAAIAGLILIIRGLTATADQESPSK